MYTNSTDRVFANVFATFILLNTLWICIAVGTVHRGTNVLSLDSDYENAGFRWRRRCDERWCERNPTSLYRARECMLWVCVCVRSRIEKIKNLIMIYCRMAKVTHRNTIYMKIELHFYGKWLAMRCDNNHLFEYVWMTWTMAENTKYDYEFCRSHTHTQAQSTHNGAGMVHANIRRSILSNTRLADRPAPIPNIHAHRTYTHSHAHRLANRLRNSISTLTRCKQTETIVWVCICIVYMC